MIAKIGQPLETDCLMEAAILNAGHMTEIPEPDWLLRVASFFLSKDV